MSIIRPLIILESGSGAITFEPILATGPLHFKVTWHGVANGGWDEAIMNREQALGHYNGAIGDGFHPNSLIDLDPYHLRRIGATGIRETTWKEQKALEQKLDALNASYGRKWNERFTRQHSHPDKPHLTQR